MKKIIVSIAAGLFLMLGAYNYVKAEDAPTCTLQLVDLKAQMPDSFNLVDVTPEQLQKFVDAVGTPPNVDTDKPYSAKLLIQGSPTNMAAMAKLVVLQDECIKVTAGPTFLIKLLEKLGMDING